MDTIKIMINGIPGNMAVTVASLAQNDGRFIVIPYSLTGPEIQEDTYQVGSTNFGLIKPEQKEPLIQKLISEEAPFISIDYTHPTAVNPNAEFYCKNNLPFVMGTTGGNRKRLMDTVTASSNTAIISPNMAKQIVGFQAMMEYAAEQFKDLFKGYTLEIKESHQAGKADTSGTARVIIGYFNKLGVPIKASDIIMIRDPKIQRDKLGVPEPFIEGHAWHTYTMRSGDDTVHFEFTINVNGRDIYAKGTLDAVAYLSEKMSQGIQGKVFSMIDVLKGV